MTTMQTTYSQDFTAAVAGQIADSGPWDIITRVAAEDIPFGRFVVINSSGKVELPDDDSLPIAGLAVYRGMLEQSPVADSPAILAGQPVSIMRKGRAYAGFSGGTLAEFVAVQMHNDDADAPALAKRGMVTASAVAANSIRTMGGLVVCHRLNAPSGLALVSLNLP